MQESWLWGFDQFINDITTTRGEIMKFENIHGETISTVQTKYIYQRLHAIMDLDTEEDFSYHLSRLMDELAHNYKVDTGNLIGEDL
jgi:hypothetical protein